MKKFKDLPFTEELQKALTDLNFTELTETQKRVVPEMLEKRDVMVCAETGSGKTAAYSVPLVQEIFTNESAMGLILAPTRELAHQIADFVRLLLVHRPDIRVTSLVGGADMRKQIKALKRDPKVIVATPGRLIDHLKRKNVSLQRVSHLVLDEGDRMLDMGFSPQLDDICKYLPKERLSSLFTATLSGKVKKLAESYLQKPKEIMLSPSSLPVETITQKAIQVKFKEKDDRVVDELNQRQGSVIVFTKTKNRTDILTKLLRSYGFAVDSIHGGKSQGQRNKAIANFRKGKSRILCATDIAARGLDVPHVEHVINYDLPMMNEDYVHRIGRTARNGAEGEALSFVMPEENGQWKQLVRKYKIPGVELKGGQGDNRKSGSERKRTFRKKKKSSSEEGSASSFKPRSKKKKTKFSGKKTTQKKSSSRSNAKPGTGGSKSFSKKKRRPRV